MTALDERLLEVLALLEKATPGEWFTGHLCRDDHACNCPYIFAGGQVGMGAIATVGTDAEEDAPVEQQKANQAVITAAVNFLREHGAELAALREQLAEARWDAKRLDWLESRATCADWNVDQPSKRIIRSDDGYEFCADTWREAIDNARASGDAASG